MSSIHKMLRKGVGIEHTKKLLGVRGLNDLKDFILAPRQSACKNYLSCCELLKWEGKTENYPSPFVYKLKSDS